MPTAEWKAKTAETRRILAEQQFNLQREQERRAQGDSCCGDFIQLESWAARWEFIFQAVIDTYFAEKTPIKVHVEDEKDERYAAKGTNDDTIL